MYLNEQINNCQFDVERYKKLSLYVQKQYTQFDLKI